MKLYIVSGDAQTIHSPTQKEFLDKKFIEYLHTIKNMLFKKHMNMTVLHTGFLNAAVNIPEKDVNRAILVCGNRIENLIDNSFTYRCFDGECIFMGQLDITWTEKTTI